MKNQALVTLVINTCFVIHPFDKKKRICPLNPLSTFMTCFQHKPLSSVLQWGLHWEKENISYKIMPRSYI